MTLVESRAVSLSSSDLKMDERKRPASYDQDDTAPPLKKQATTVNGGSTRHVDADMPWKDDLEVGLPLRHETTLIDIYDTGPFPSSLPYVCFKALTGLSPTAIPKRGHLAADARI